MPVAVPRTAFETRHTTIPQQKIAAAIQRDTKSPTHFDGTSQDHLLAAGEARPKDILVGSPYVKVNEIDSGQVGHVWQMFGRCLTLYRLVDKTLRFSVHHPCPAFYPAAG